MDVRHEHGGGSACAGGSPGRRDLRCALEDTTGRLGDGVRRAHAGLVGLMIVLAVTLAACGSSSTGSLGGGEDREATTGSNFPGVDGAGKQGPNVASSVDQLTSGARPGTSSYRIGPEDVLEVTVFRVPELTKAAQVSETGHINLPLVGELVVASKTSQEVERELTARLGAKYLHNPQVTVMVKEYNSQRLTVEGEVKKPGVYPLRGRTTLIQALAMAGGLEQVADSSEIIVFRQNGQRKAAARFNLDAIRTGQARDPELAPGDVVVVSSSALKSAFNNVVKMLPLAGVFVGLI